MDERKRLEGHASLYLQALDCQEGVFSITISCGSLKHRFEVPCWKDPPPCQGCGGSLPAQGKAHTLEVPMRPDELPVVARWLSPLEERIFAALNGRGWTTASELCRLLGESDTGDIRAVIRNLVERDILDSAPSRGYRHKITTNEKPTG